jgi:hypothetical protein
VPEFLEITPAWIEIEGGLQRWIALTGMLDMFHNTFKATSITKGHVGDLN